MKMQEQDYSPIVNNLPQYDRAKSGGFGKQMRNLVFSSISLAVGMFGAASVTSISLGFVAPAAAQAGQEGGDFTFRRVAPPQSGGKRITVQIDPDAETFRITPGSEPRRPGDPRPDAAMRLPADLLPAAPSEYDWYWE